MKTRFTFIVLSLLLASATVSVAQNSILAGKITDENNKAVPYAVVKLSHSGVSVTAIADENGLYYTPQLKTGKYLVSITSTGKVHPAGRVILRSATANKQFYNFAFTGNIATTTVTATDPFMSTRLEAIANSDLRREILFDGHRIVMLNIDSVSGKPQIIQSRSVVMPR